MGEALGAHELYREKSPSILVLRAGAIGDTLMVTPLVRALRRTFPHAYLGFVCSHAAYDVVRANPHLDEVIPLARRHVPMFLSGEKRRLVRHFQDVHPDSVLALESHPDLTELACRIGAARVITYDTTRQGSNIEHVLPEPNQHSVETHLRAGARLGVRPAGLDLEFHYPPATDDALNERLAQYGIHDSDLVVGIHAGWGNRKQHPTETRLRSWPADRFAQVIRWLVEKLGARVVLTGSRVDRPLAEFIARLANVQLLNMAGQLSLFELAALIRRMNLYLTVDSGAAHIAAALGTPLVTLWGPGIIKATAPLAGRGPVRILYSPPPCAPCYGTPLMKSCQDNICMKQISVAEVITTVEEVLASRLG
jgi:ADP-heptose:LPS heptosyltransferase